MNLFANNERLSKRQSGVELLRIIAMLFITAHHYVLYGIISPINGDAGNCVKEVSDLNQFITQLFFCGGDIGVNIFFIITGYFLITQKRTNFKGVILQTVFYCAVQLIFFVTDTACFGGVFYEELSLYDKVKAFCGYLFAPISSSRFWFATAYILLVIVSPIYNTFLCNLNKRGFLLFTVNAFAIGVLLGTYFIYPYLGFTKAFALYAVGAFLKMHCSGINLIDTKFKRAACLLTFIFSVALMAVICFLNECNFEFMHSIVKFTTRNIVYFILAVVSAVSSLLFFKSFDFKNKWVNLVASTTFGIYLLQEGVFNRTAIWGHIFDVVNGQFLSEHYFVYAIITIIAMFVIFSISDLIRQIVFEPYYMKIPNYLRTRFIKNNKDICND